MYYIKPYKAIILPCLFPCGALLGLNSYISASKDAATSAESNARAPARRCIEVWSFGTGKKSLGLEPQRFEPKWLREDMY